MHSRLSDTVPSIPSDRGFTMIELITVLVVIGVLVAVSTPLYTSLQSSSAKDSARSALRAANQGVEAYYTDEGTFLGISASVLQTSYDHSLHPYSLSSTYDDPVAVVSEDSGASFVLCSKVKSWWAYKNGPADSIHYTTSLADRPADCPIP